MNTKVLFPVFAFSVTLALLKDSVIRYYGRLAVQDFFLLLFFIPELIMIGYYLGKE